MRPKLPETQPQVAECRTNAHSATLASLNWWHNRSADRYTVRLPTWLLSDHLRQRVRTPEFKSH
eukprot:460716-Amphidinium_carterae.1